MDAQHDGHAHEEREEQGQEHGAHDVAEVGRKQAGRGKAGGGHIMMMIATEREPSYYHQQRAAPESLTRLFF